MPRTPPPKELPLGIDITNELFSRMFDAAPKDRPIPTGIREVFRQGMVVGEDVQESLLTIMLPSARRAAITRAESSKGRGLIVVDQRKGGVVWYLAEAQARPALKALPEDLWAHIARMLREHDPSSELLLIRLVGRSMDVIYFDHTDMMSTLGDRPIPIPVLPHPLAQEQLPRFELPAGVTVRQETRPNGRALLFQHARLGLLGQMMLTDHPSGQLLLSSFVAGHPEDPMTEERKALFLPIVDALSRRLDVGLGHSDPGPVDFSTPLPPALPEAREASGTPAQTATTIHACARCGKDMVFLIFADDPRLPLEDYARLMFEAMREKNLVTFVLGPAQRTPGVSLDDSPSALLQVWPERKPARTITPNAFDQLIQELSQAHCGGRR